MEERRAYLSWQEIKDKEQQEKDRKMAKALGEGDTPFEALEKSLVGDEAVNGDDENDTIDVNEDNNTIDTRKAA